MRRATLALALALLAASAAHATDPRSAVAAVIAEPAGLPDTAAAAASAAGVASTTAAVEPAGAPVLQPGDVSVAQPAPAAALGGAAGVVTSTPAAGAAATAPGSKPTPQEAAAAAAATALSRAGGAGVIASAWPAPHYSNYSLSTSRDTFEICKNQSGLKREISLEELLPIYGLPPSLLRHRRVSVADLAAALAASAPSARLVIAPLLAGEAELSPVLHPDGRLPRLVHFTVRYKDAMLPHQALAIASWARLNPGYSILLYDDADIAEFMATYHPAHVPLFESLGSQVERTDLWRYLVLCTFGGVYADSDVVAGRPVSSWAQDAGLLAGVENVFETMAAARRRDYTRVMQMTQWTIAARRGHQVLCRMPAYVQKRVDAERAGEVQEEDRDHAILERTGPGIWSSSVHDYLREHGVTPESMVGGGVVGDVRILPQSTFGCASSTVNLADPMAYVYHMFKGSWRLNEHERLWQFVSHLYAHLFALSPAPSPPAPASPGVVAARGGALAAGAGGGAGGGLYAGIGVAGQESGGVSAAAGEEAAERRLHEQEAPRGGGGAAMAAAMQLHARGGLAAAPHPSPARALRLLPLASLLVVAVFAAGVLAQRGSGKCGSSGGAGAAGRPCGWLRQSVGGALVGIWGGASRLAGRGGGGGLSSSASAASLLPLTQVSPKLGGGGSGGGSGGGGGVVSSTVTRSPAGGSTGGCLKRCGGSMQCLSSAGMQ